MVSPDFRLQILSNTLYTVLRVCPSHLCCSVLALIVSVGYAVAEEDSATSALQRFDDLQKQTKRIPPDLFNYSPSLHRMDEQEVIDGIRDLVRKADTLPITLLQSKDASRRGLAVVVFGLSDSPERIMGAMSLLSDKEKTSLREVTLGEHMSMGNRRKHNGRKLSVSDCAHWVLDKRLISFAGMSFSPFPVGLDKEKYLSRIDSLQLVSSYWTYRFRRTVAWSRDLESRQKAITRLVNTMRATLKSRPEYEAILMAGVLACMRGSSGELPTFFTDEEMIAALKRMSPKRLRAYLDGTWRAPWMVLRKGPNSKKQTEALRAILRFIPRVLKQTDALWVYQAGRKTSMEASYCIAASRLDPSKGVDWLKKDISAAEDRSVQCLMLEALWSIAGDKESRYIVGRFYQANRPKNPPGLQVRFIQRLAKNEGKKSLPLLRAIILDKRFSTLGWGTTRALAEQTKLILGQETKESKRYLRVQHALGVSTYESDPKRRSNHLVDTKHVEMQTKLFKGYLQAAVRAKGNTE